MNSYEKFVKCIQIIAFLIFISFYLKLFVFVFNFHLKNYFMKEEVKMCPNIIYLYSCSNFIYLYFIYFELIYFSSHPKLLLLLSQNHHILYHFYLLFLNIAPNYLFFVFNKLIILVLKSFPNLKILIIISLFTIFFFLFFSFQVNYLLFMQYFFPHQNFIFFNLNINCFSHNYGYNFLFFFKIFNFNFFLINYYSKYFRYFSKYPDSFFMQNNFFQHP